MTIGFFGGRLKSSGNLGEQCLKIFRWCAHTFRLWSQIKCFELRFFILQSLFSGGKKKVKSQKGYIKKACPMDQSQFWLVADQYRWCSTAYTLAVSISYTWTQTSATSALGIAFVSVCRSSSSFPTINSLNPPSLSCRPPGLNLWDRIKEHHKTARGEKKIITLAPNLKLTLQLWSVMRSIPAKHPTTAKSYIYNIWSLRQIHAVNELLPNLYQSFKKETLCTIQRNSSLDV